MSGKVGSFFIDLVVDAATGNLSVKQLVAGLGELQVASVGTVGVIEKISEKIWDMGKAAVGTAVDMARLHALTGIDPKIAQQWDKAAEEVTHHSGSIIRAISAVNDMNMRLDTEGTPDAITGVFQTNPWKRDKAGKQIPKDAIDYLKEFAAPGSTYRSRDELTQQRNLPSIFKSAGEDMFLVIKELIANKMHPEQISVLENKQIADLNHVDSDWIKVKQDVVGIFDKFLTVGGVVDNILHGADVLLKFIEKFIDLIGKREGKPVVNPLLGASGGVNIPFNPGAMLGQELANRVNAAADTTEKKYVEKNSKVEIELRNGKNRFKTYVELGTTRQDFWNMIDFSNLEP